MENNTTINLESTQIFSDVMISNNKRLLISFAVIIIISNVAVTLIKMTGKGSQYLTYTDIIIEFLLVTFIFIITTVLTRKLGGTRLSTLIAITNTMIMLIIFQYSFFGASELFASFYIAMALSVFYFDKRFTIYTLVMIIIAQTILFILKPELIPGGPKSNLLVRYIVYLAVGVGATGGATATRAILKLAIDKNDESQTSLSNLKEVARTLVKSVDVLKTRSQEQDTISENLNKISQNQAAALEEITASLEELAGNSESISGIAKNLYEELNITLQSVNDLKLVNDKTQSSSDAIINSVEEVTGYSNNSSDHIRMTLERFGTLEIKSKEMSNFIMVINDIADKVNLLSLNAAIEAARAGDTGRGFAVVADEISKLADATSENAKKISAIINENQSLINESGKLIVESSDIMQKLNSSISSIKTEIAEVHNLISDTDVTIKMIKNLNATIHESSKTIEHSTSEQKIATNESSRTITDIATKAQDIVQSAQAISESTNIINELAGEFDSLTKKMAQ